MTTASLSRLQHPVLGVFAWPKRRLLATHTLEPGNTYVFGRAPSLAESRHHALRGQQLAAIDLAAGESPVLGRVQLALRVGATSISALDLHPEPRLRVQHWGAAQAQLLSVAFTPLRGLSCIWMPSPGLPGVDAYQLAIANPAVLRATENLRVMSTRARDLIAADDDGQEVGDSAGGGDPYPTDGQFGAIIERYAGQVAFPPASGKFAAQGKHKSPDRALDRLQARVSRCAGWPMGRSEAIAYLCEGGLVHPAAMQRAAQTLGVDLGFDWIEAAIREQGAA